MDQNDQNTKIPAENQEVQPKMDASQQIIARRKADANNNIKLGCIWFIIGLVLTIATFVFSDVTGGFFFVAYGPVIYGIIMVFIGIKEKVFG
jgi:hypothetical protein